MASASSSGFGRCDTERTETDVVVPLTLKSLMRLDHEKPSMPVTLLSNPQIFSCLLYTRAPPQTTKESTRCGLLGALDDAFLCRRKSYDLGVHLVVFVTTFTFRRMFIKTLKNLFVVSGPLVLLLLVVVQHTAGATTTESSNSFCEAEFEACYNDDVECSDCISGWTAVDGAMDEFNECVQNQDWYSAADTCSFWAGAACCQAEVSSNDCLANSAFVGYWTCYSNEASISAGYGGCTTFSCDGTSAGGTGGTSGVGSSSSATFTVPRLVCLAAAPILAVLL